MKAVKETVRKYYKYQYSEWVQPTLSGYGTPYVSDLAVTASITVSSYEVWKAFDKNTSTFYILKSVSNPTGVTANIITKNQLNVTTMVFKNRAASNYAITGVIIYGLKKDGTVLYQKSYSNTSYGAGAEWTVDMSDNTQYCDYYQIYCTGGQYGGSASTSLAELYITATQRIPVPSDESDYDFYEDVDVYELVKRTKDSKDTYYAIKSFEKGQYHGN